MKCVKTLKNNISKLNKATSPHLPEVQQQLTGSQPGWRMLAIHHKLPAILVLNALLFLLNPFSACAQTLISDGVSISVSATVVDSESISIEIITLQNIAIRPEDFLEGMNEIFVSPITAVNAGLMLLQGNPNAGVKIHYQPKEFIYSESGDDYMKINYVMSGSGERNQEASFLFNTTDIFIKLNDDGEYFLWIGGLIHLSNATTGLYSGNFVFEVSYL